MVFGIGLELICEVVGELGFLVGVFEFYMMDEILFLIFCENVGVWLIMMVVVCYVLFGGIGLDV